MTDGLDRVCTHILAFEGNSNVVFFEGGYSDYEENRKKRLGDISPKRIKYRKLKKRLINILNDLSDYSLFTTFLLTTFVSKLFLKMIGKKLI